MKKTKILLDKISLRIRNTKTINNSEIINNRLYNLTSIY